MFKKKFHIYHYTFVCQTDAGYNISTRTRRQKRKIVTDRDIESAKDGNTEKILLSVSYLGRMTMDEFGD